MEALIGLTIAAGGAVVAWVVGKWLAGRTWRDV